MVLALLAVKVLVAVIDPAVRDPPVEVSKNSEENVAVTAFSIEANRLVEVALVLVKLVIVAVATERLEIVVVAKVDVPCTMNSPVLVVLDSIELLADKVLVALIDPATSDVAVALPVGLTLKAVLSAHRDPFQYRVLLVTVPEATLLLPLPETVVHLVLVPVVVSTWPDVPVDPKESKTFPVNAMLVAVALVVIRLDTEADTILVSPVRPKLLGSKLVPPADTGIYKGNEDPDDEPYPSLPDTPCGPCSPRGPAGPGIYTYSLLTVFSSLTIYSVTVATLLDVSMLLIGSSPGVDLF